MANFVIKNGKKYQIITRQDIEKDIEKIEKIGRYNLAMYSSIMELLEDELAECDDDDGDEYE